MWQWHSTGGPSDGLAMALMMTSIWGPILVLLLIILRSVAGAGSTHRVEVLSREEEVRRAHALEKIDRDQFPQITAGLDEGRRG